MRIIDGGVEIVRNHRTDKEAGRRAFFDFAAGEKQLKYPGLRTWLTADATPCTEKQASSGQRAFPDIEVRWCDDPQQVDALARFFVDNASGSTDYISHGEIQDGRAEAPNQWSPDLLSVITGAFGSAVSPQNPGRDSARLAVALSQNEVVGIALVDFRLSAKQPFAVLQDLVVSGQRRSSGVGSVMLRWVEARVLEQGCRLLFLESGITNERAHSFFERHGFSVCSKVMIKQLPGQRPTGLVAS